jgi:hypothetical protein
LAGRLDQPLIPARASDPRSRLEQVPAPPNQSQIQTRRRINNRLSNWVLWIFSIGGESILSSILFSPEDVDSANAALSFTMSHRRQNLKERRCLHGDFSQFSPLPPVWNAALIRQVKPGAPFLVGQAISLSRSFMSK